MSLEPTDQFAANYPWISNSFFEQMLRRENQDNTIIVKDYTLQPALAKGENYASQMLRVRVNYSSSKDPSIEHISLIVKTFVVGNAEVTAIAKELNVFHKEIFTYQQIIPRVEELLRSIGDHSRMSAKCYDSSEELSYLVLEDMSVLGYANMNRRTGLDFEHFQHVLTKAAKWHAATAILLKEKPSLADEFQTNMLLSESFKPLMIHTNKALVDVVKYIPGFEHLSTKLERLSTCVIQKLTDAVELNPNAFNVITHGDMWANNAMFRHDSVDGSPTDVILVDFQCGYFGSPVLDILYALYSSSNENLCAKDWDDLVIHYHTELVRLLSLFQYLKPVPTLLELQADRLKRIHYGAMIGINGQGVRNLENVQDDEFNKFFGPSQEDHKFRVQTMLNPKILKSLKFLLQYFDDNGLFDV